MLYMAILLRGSTLSPDGSKLASVGAKATMFFEAGGSGQPSPRKWRIDGFS